MDPLSFMKNHPMPRAAILIPVGRFRYGIALVLAFFSHERAVLTQPPHRGYEQNSMLCGKFNPPTVAHDWGTYLCTVSRRDMLRD